MKVLTVSALTVLGVAPIQFSVAPGECLCLSGPSGAGKTLLLRALADLDPHSGTVTLGELDQRHCPPPQWRHAVGLLPAESSWWLELVGDHFSTPPTTEQLTSLGLPSDALTWSCQRLSSGEKQRLALLRLLLNQPKALLLDEPTANLDPVAIHQVETLIARLRLEQSMPVVWVSHDPQQIRRVATRHLCFNQGRLVEGPL